MRCCLAATRIRISISPAATRILSSIYTETIATPFVQASSACNHVPPLTRKAKLGQIGHVRSNDSARWPQPAQPSTVTHAYCCEVALCGASRPDNAMTKRHAASVGSAPRLSRNAVWSKLNLDEHRARLEHVQLYIGTPHRLTACVALSSSHHPTHCLAQRDPWPTHPRTRRSLCCRRRQHRKTS